MENYSTNAILDAAFKDASPLKTVELIDNILESHNIKITKTWNESGITNCYSLRITVDGTNFGVNGKGLTPEFALASAYGELMERMQLGLLADSSVQKIGHYNENIGNGFLMDSDAVYEEMQYWYDFLAEQSSLLDGKSKNGKDILSSFAMEDNKIATIPFFNIMTGKRVNIPRDIKNVVCGSNGGAAGNTMEEAIIQACSEIVERHYKQIIVNECISSPSIPEHVLEKFPMAYKIICELRCKGIEVSVKDCSMGTRFPVVCVCYISKETGKYHTHFGAYPILEIAIERALTESFQGRDIEKLFGNSDFIYKKEDLFSYRSIYNDLKKGSFDKSPDFFIGECKYPYNPNVGFDGKSNKELFPQVIEFFKEQGLEILVYNSSSLGFPTYSILIPTFSEVIFHSISSGYKIFENSKSAIKVLRSPSEADMSDFFLCLLHISEMRKLSEVYAPIFTFSNLANLSLSLSKEKSSYLISISLAYIYYSMNNISSSLSFLAKAIPFARAEDIDILLCLKRYLSMKLNNRSEDEARKIISHFHKESTVNYILSSIDKGENPFNKFILHCDLENCDSCFAKSYCKQKYTQHLINTVHQGAIKLSFDDFANELKKYV